MHEQEQPQERSRRSARYEQPQADRGSTPLVSTHSFPPQAPVQPACNPPLRRPAAPVPTQQSPMHQPPAPPVHMPQVDAPNPGYSRPMRPAPREKSRRTPISPRMWVGLGLAVAAVMGVFLGNHFMRQYVTRQQEARAKAYQQVLQRHPMNFQPLIEQYAREFNLHPAYVSAIIMNESSFRTDAESNVGARGLMQLMPDTAEWIAGKLDIPNFSFDRMYDAESNIRFGTWYLNYLAKLFQGDPVAVACGYHAGQGQVQKWLSDSTISPDGRRLVLDNLKDGPTKTYARRVTQAYGIYETIYYAPAAAVPAVGADAAPDAGDAGTGI